MRMIIVCIIWHMQHLEVLVLYSTNAVVARIRTTRLELPLPFLRLKRWTPA